MNNSFWRLIWSSFQEIQSFWYGFLGFLITIVLSITAGTTPIPLFWVLGIITLFILIIATICRAFYTLDKEYQKVKKSNFSKIIRVHKDPNTGIISYLLLEYSELFTNDLIISFLYTDENGNEVIIGIGFIEKIQNNQRMKAIIIKPFFDYQDIFNKLANENKTVLEQIIVIPGMHRNTFFS